MRHSVNRLDLGRLCEPLSGVFPEVSVCLPETPVVGVSSDSRTVQPGELFIATPGSRDDGLLHVGEALARGATSVLADRKPELPEGVGFVGVPDVPLAKAVVADTFYGQPSRRLKVVGITGTNGKTTTAYLLRAMLSREGVATGLVGTLGALLGDDEHVELSNTTPDALELQRLLAQMVDRGLSAVVMEVSSHSLVQHRVRGVDFDVGVFTNLSQDHLDYHGTMEAYGDAKALLFEGLAPEAVAVLNADDPFCSGLARRTRASVVRYGFSDPVHVRGDVSRSDSEGSAFRLVAGARGLSLPCETRLVGRHNVANALAAGAAALSLGVSPTAVATGLASLPAVPGRLQPVECGQDFRVLVDYAHTPDALEKVLSQLRPLTRGRLAVVFGCGGDRDRGKRPLMGAVAARLADDVYVTSDNPRSEDPQAILEDILRGMRGDGPPGQRRLAHADRREAIRQACLAAQGGDIVLVAGKGHETTQTLGDEVLPFDDCAVTREVLWRL